MAEKQQRSASPAEIDIPLDDSTMARARADFASLQALAQSNTVVRSMIASSGIYATPQLPACKINGDNSIIEYGGKSYPVSFEGAVLFQELVDSFPMPKGLTTDDRPQPKRLIAKLPGPLQELIETTNKGSVLKL